MNRKILALFCAVGMSCAAFADDFSSSVRGQIFEPSGAPAANTKIVITHVPTNVSRTYQTNNSGSFVASGLRVGSGYKILIDSDNFQDKEITDVTLDLGNPFVIKETLVSLDSRVSDENTIVITASARDYRNPNTSSNSVFGRREIEGSPSLNRDLKDVLRRNPLVNVLDNDVSSLSVAGNNPRYNSISVDGIRQDDDFGLNGSGFPTQRSSISIDAIDQISINTNPFNVKDGGFTGAGISIVTKSGTNEFKGEAFYEINDDKHSGNARDDRGIDIPLDYKEETLGFSLGGPIIKDKLFFYVNYEDFDSPSGAESGPAGSASGSPADVSLADANEVIRIAQDVYGLDAGDWTSPSVEEDTKILAKIDWVINDAHRASFTYQNTDGELTANNNGGRSLNLSSHWYTRGDELTAFSGQLFSDWTPNFSTEIRVSDKEVINQQISLAGSSFGDIEVRTATGSVNLGSDRSRHANRLNNDTFAFSFHGDYLMNAHTISFGWQMDEIDIFNIFVQDSLGTWVFDGLDNFENRIADRFRYQNADSGNADDAAAEFSIRTDALYIGDVWDVNPNLTLQFGLRYEMISTDDEPRFNQNFFDRYGFSNQATLDGEDIILPRFGFNWTATDDLTISGGFGKYTGGRPNVWLSNAYTNDGVTIVRPNLNNLNPDDFLTNVDPTQIPQAVTDALETGDGNSTPIDPDFELPSHWQYSLNAQYIADLGYLGDNWTLNAEVIYKDIDKDVKWIDLAREQIGTTVEGRPIYTSFDPVTNNRNHYDLLLTNSSGGDSTIFTLAMNKSFESGVDFNLSYAHQDINDRVPGTSSTAESNFQFTSVYDRQNPDVATAAYEVEHRLAMNIDYSVDLFEGYTTTFGLFAERVSGRPFSWTLGAFRDGDLGDQENFDDSDSYLVYIPTGPNDAAVDFSCSRCLSYDEIIAQARAQGISTEGGVLARNAYTSPWKTNVDLSIRQEVPGFVKGHKGEIYFIFDNFLNFIDSSQGQIESNRFGESQQILFDYDINADGQYQLQTPFGGFRQGSPATFREKESAWRLKFGVRYKF